MTHIERTTQFTPGPWQAIREEDRGSWFIDTALGVESTNEYVIADDIIGTDAKANAYLIAAAPELYEALDAILAEDNPSLSELNTRLETGRRALRKARGGNQ